MVSVAARCKSVLICALYWFFQSSIESDAVTDGCDVGNNCAEGGDTSNTQDGLYSHAQANATMRARAMLQRKMQHVTSVVDSSTGLADEMKYHLDQNPNQECSVTVCPDDNQANCEDTYKATAIKKFSLTDHRRRRAMSDEISSVFVGEGCDKVKLYDDDDYADAPLVTSKSLNELPYDFDDDVSHVELFPKPKPIVRLEVKPCSVNIMSSFKTFGYREQLATYSSASSSDGFTVNLSDAIADDFDAISMTEGCAYVKLVDEDSDGDVIYVPQQAELFRLPYDFSYDTKSITIYQKDFGMHPLQNTCPAGYHSMLGAGTKIESAPWANAFNLCDSNEACCGIAESADSKWKSANKDMLELVGCDVQEKTDKRWFATCVKDNKSQDVCDTIAFGASDSPSTYSKIGVGLCTADNLALDTNSVAKLNAGECQDLCSGDEECKGYAVDSSGYCSRWLLESSSSVTGGEITGSSGNSSGCYAKNAPVILQGHPWSYASLNTSKTGAIEQIKDVLNVALGDGESATKTILASLLSAYSTEVSASAADVTSKLSERAFREISMLAVHGLAIKYGTDDNATGDTASLWGAGLYKNLQTSSCIQVRATKGLPPAQLPGTCENYNLFDEYEVWYKTLNSTLQLELLKLGMLSISKNQKFESDGETYVASEDCFTSKKAIDDEEVLQFNIVQSMMMESPRHHKKLFDWVVQSQDYPDMCQWKEFINNHSRPDTVAALAEFIGTYGQITLATLYTNELFGYDAEEVFMELGALLELFLVFAYEGTSWPAVTVNDKVVTADVAVGNAMALMATAAFMQSTYIAAMSFDINQAVGSAEEFQELKDAIAAQYPGEEENVYAFASLAYEMIAETIACKGGAESCQYLYSNTTQRALVESLLQQEDPDTDVDIDLTGRWQKASLASSALDNAFKVGSLLWKIGKCINENLTTGDSYTPPEGGYYSLLEVDGEKPSAPKGKSKKTKTNSKNGTSSCPTTEQWIQTALEIPIGLSGLADELAGVTAGVKALAFSKLTPAEKSSRMITALTVSLSQRVKLATAAETVKISVIVDGATDAVEVSKLKASWDSVKAFVGGSWVKVKKVVSAVKSGVASLVGGVRALAQSQLGKAVILLASKALGVVLQGFAIMGLITDVRTLIGAFEDGKIAIGIFTTLSAIGGAIGIASAIVSPLMVIGFVTKASLMGSLFGPAGAVVGAIIGSLAALALFLHAELNPPPDGEEQGKEFCCYAWMLDINPEILVANWLWNAKQLCKDALDGDGKVY